LQKPNLFISRWKINNEGEQPVWPVRFSLGLLAAC